MCNAFAIVTPSERHTTVKGMQNYRPISAFSFLGRYRLIDFPVSNLSNSGVDRIQVYVSQNPRSLAEHLGDGRVYNINSKKGKLQLLFNQDSVENDIYNTDVQAYASNIDIIKRQPQDYVIITPGYMVFRQDFSALLDEHVKSGADVTLLYHKVNNAKEHFRNLTYLTVNRQKGVKSIEPNLGNINDRNIFMSTYVMKKDLLIELVAKAQKVSSMFNLISILNLESDSLDIRGYQHKGYFSAIYDFRSYYEANLELLDQEKAFDLFGQEDWPIYTVTTDSSPVHYYDCSSVTNSMIANGSRIYGTVENSIIGRGVEIKSGAVIRNSVILGHSTIEENVVLENQVIDKWAHILEGRKIISPADDPGYIRRDDTI